MDGSTAVLSAQFNLEKHTNFNFTICPPPLHDASPLAPIPPIVQASSSNLPFLNQSMDDLLNELSSKPTDDSFSSSEKMLNGLPFSPTANICNSALDYSQHDPSMNEFLNIYGGLFESASMPATIPSQSPPLSQPQALSPENTCIKQGPSSPISVAFNMENMINSLEMLKEPDVSCIGESTSPQSINTSITDTSRFSFISPTSAIDAANSPPASCYPGLVLPPNLFVPIVPAATSSVCGSGSGVNESNGYSMNNGPDFPRKSISKAEARKIRNRLSAARSNLRSQFYLKRNYIEICYIKKRVKLRSNLLY